ncbi:ABC transporter permease [Enterococcus dongliensis]|uniref:ABC transporter permease n=1 Tax=Enterococcus dongliensis TaxID=2559925 RepID=UPI00288EA221|nr:ABC transporter permease [Enterococcus dongliensis]MDT2604024.1 ABC transporter permease [Enterococcus dongliensis]MDT2638712.1 ABC transporter permease [Enterococcus dongliensis]MDT2645174.1 ABC transporter permease [Enterococcus dongliensis]MDT2671602.1 ABC transporter permease [Enterococcus dongliensis]MDT2676738.1 ABC transporter permease [Enterococcus dongliensis]
MNYIKRALQNLWAKKGRSILMIAVFSAILIFILAGLTIRSGAELATTNAKKSVGATVTLSQNREAMFKQSSDSENSRPEPGSFEQTPINLSDAEKIAKLANIKTYSFEASTSADKSSGITPISSDSEETAASEAEGKGVPAGMSQGNFQIKGVSQSSAYSDFSAGTASIVEGEAITADDEGTNNVLIEQSLAESNDLSVGDTFKIKDTDDKDVEVTIKGIYKTSSSGDSMSARFNFMNPANTVFSSYTLVSTLTGSEGETIDSAVYTLDDPKEMDSFVKQANKLIDTDTFSLETNDQMYQQMLQPLNNVSSFAKNIVILVATAGVIILTLIIMLSIRERKYEVGVLLSLGESRLKVISQFFVEIFVCMIFALGIAAASGNVVGNAVGNQLLNQQTTSQSIDGNTRNAGPGQALSGNGGSRSRQIGGNPFTQIEEVKEMNIAVKPTEILNLAGIGLGISLFSIVLSSAGILRLNPKKILIS